MNRSAARTAQSKKVTKKATTRKTVQRQAKSTKSALKTQKRTKTTTLSTPFSTPLTSTPLAATFNSRSKKPISFSSTTSLSRQSPLTTLAASFSNAQRPFTPTSSKYLNWVNAPPTLHWKEVVQVFQGQGFNVKVDQDEVSPTFFRVKFDTSTECADAFKRLNGFKSNKSSQPLELRLGRSFRAEGSMDDLVTMRLNVISGPANLSWNIIKDSLQAYVPILSVDQLSASAYKVRIYTRTDFDYILMNLSKKRVPIPIGGDIVFEVRPWMTPPGAAGEDNQTGAQKKLCADWLRTARGKTEGKIVNTQIVRRAVANATPVEGDDSIPATKRSM